MMNLPLVILLCILANQVRTNAYLSLLHNLNMKSPYIVGKLRDMKTQSMIFLMKETMKRNQTVCVTTSIKDENARTSPGIIIQSDQYDKVRFHENNFTSTIQRPWILTGEVEKHYFPIDKPLYVFTNGTLLEHFEIKGLKKTNKLGRLYGKKFMWHYNIPRNFFERRGNFENITLIAMTAEEMAYNKFPKDWKSLVNISSLVPDAYEVINYYIYHLSLFSMFELNLPNFQYMPSKFFLKEINI